MSLFSELEKELEGIKKADWYLCCDFCGWKLVREKEVGCTENNCSRRPLPVQSLLGQFQSYVRKLVRYIRALMDMVVDAEKRAMKAEHLVDSYQQPKIDEAWMKKWEHKLDWSDSDWHQAALEKVRGE